MGYLAGDGGTAVSSSGLGLSILTHPSYNETVDRSMMCGLRMVKGGCIDMAKNTADVRHCPLCGRLFMKTNRSVCDICALEEDKMIETVVTWLRRNPNSSLQQIVEATGVDEKIVLRLIRDDRVVVVSTMVHCERCSTLIHSGRFCAACRREMAQAMLAENPALYRQLVAAASGQFHTQLFNPIK